MLTNRSQAVVIARRYGMSMASKPETADVYGRWSADFAELSVVWHERGWWCGLRAFRPSGAVRWTLKTDHGPDLSEIERLVVAARDGFRAENAEDAA